MIIITIINVEDFKLYSIFNSNLIIMNEIVHFLRMNIWNFFVNYCNFFIILVKNERQLRFVIQETFKKNVFVYFMNMSLFHRLKFLNHFSMMLRIQYRMMNIIKYMIFMFFYNDEFINAFNTKFFQRSFSQTLIQHNTQRYNVQFFLMMLNVFNEF